MADSAWTGMVPVGDTALSVHDTRGPGVPVLYLNGQFAARTYWRRVIAELGTQYRHITYDMRGRGRSRRSVDQAFDTHVGDIDDVLAVTGAERPLLVGWSYGAAVAVRWADLHTDRLRGVVSVDGAYPFDWTDAAMEERIRRLFHRMRCALPLAAHLGMAARMSAAQHAESNIELNVVCAGLGPVLEELGCPARWVVATGGNFGGGAEEMERMRASLQPVLARNPDVRVTAKVASNHATVLRKDFRAIAAAVRELASAEDTTREPAG